MSSPQQAPIVTDTNNRSVFVTSNIPGGPEGNIDPLLLPIPTAQENLNAYQAGVNSRHASSISEAVKPLPFCVPGRTPEQGSAIITIRDGGAKKYNAFPHTILVGSTLYTTVCSMTGHITRDSDVWLYKSENYGASEWVGTKILSATGTTGAIVNGDKEYRYTGLAHLGGDKLLAMCHSYTVTDSNNLGEVVGNDIEWSVSSDMGVTWGALQAIPYHTGATWLGSAGNPFLFKGRVYIGGYTGGANGERMWSQSLAEIEDGTNNNWREEWVSNGTENHLTVSPDGTELRSYSRVAVDINLRSTTDGTTWTNHGPIGLSALPWGQTQPCVEELADGTLIHMGRLSSTSLEARIFYKRTTDANWQMSSTPIGSNRDVPAWGGVEKHVYNTMIPFGGGLVGCIYALEAKEEWNTDLASTGHRASLYYSLFASGDGLTPLGRFTPKKLPVLSGSEINLAQSPPVSAKTLTDDTTLSIVGSGEKKRLIVDGDHNLTIDRRYTTTGEYDGSGGKSAILEIENGHVNLIIRQGFDPRDIVGCNMLLTPESLVHNGTIVTAWTDLSDAGHTVTTNPGNEPAVSLASSPNGKNAVQGALGDYFVLTTAGSTWDIGSLYAVFNYPNSNFDGFNTIMSNIIQGDGTTNNLNFGNYPSTPSPTFTTINDAPYDALTFDPQAWARYGTRMLVTDPVTKTEDSQIMDRSGDSRLMTQAGFSGSRNWLGKLVCLVTFDRRLTNEEDAQMQKWLTHQ